MPKKEPLPATADPNEITNTVLAVLRNECRITGALGPQSHLQKDLKLDSVGLLTLSLEVENKYRIILDDDPDQPPRTVQDVIDLVQRSLTASNATAGTDNSGTSESMAVLEGVLTDPAQSQVFPGDTLTDAILALQNCRDQFALQFMDRSKTISRHPWSVVSQSAMARAAALQRLGLQPGEAVTLVMGTCLDFIENILAVLLAGGIPNCLPTPRLSRQGDYSSMIQSRLDVIHPVFVITEERLQDKLTGICANQSHRHILNGEAPAALDEAQSYTRPAAVHAHSPALLQFTSGTTTDPRAVVLSHANICRNTRAILHRLPGNLEDHSGFAWLPLHHDMGLIGGLFTALMAGGSITFLKPEDFAMRPALWLQGLSLTRATICPAPNFAMQMCTDRIKSADLEGLDLSHWQIALTGAETVQEETLRSFYHHFKACGFQWQSFTPVYGLAEATLAVSFSAIEKEPGFVSADRLALEQDRFQAGDGSRPLVRIASVGTPLEDTRIQIRSATGALLRSDQIGQIWLQGAGVMQGYRHEHKIETRPAENVWLDTGDRGFMHAGELYIYGRTRDLIIINGRNIDPGWLEHAVPTLPGINPQRSCAYAISGKDKPTESPGLLIEIEKSKDTNSDYELLLDQIHTAVAEASGFLVAEIHLLKTGSLPRTSSGKIRRTTAWQELQQGRLAVVAARLF
ncbi:MAG: AMP-binding protein [Leptospiraceae bacterium]|nr:AMP-binding protein [Leptospiraceae bacterium]